MFWEEGGGGKRIPRLRAPQHSFLSFLFTRLGIPSRHTSSFSVREESRNASVSSLETILLLVQHLEASMFPRPPFPELRTLFLLTLLAAFSIAGPLYDRSHAQQQQILKSDGLIMQSKQQKQHPSQFLDARPNSIGVLLTTAGGEEEEVLHLWLPIGERVYSRT